MRCRDTGSLLLLLLALLSTSGELTATRAAVRNPSVASAEIEATLVRFSNALARGDGSVLRKLTSSNFSLLDEGRVYNYESSH